MTTTEEEAKKKWCYRSNGIAVYGDNDHVDPEKCCASLCMAWRWLDSGSVLASERRGYCGVAGVPTQMGK
jgi:hypothetical protein